MSPSNCGGSSAGRSPRSTRNRKIGPRRLTNSRPPRSRPRRPRKLLRVGWWASRPLPPRSKSRLSSRLPEKPRWIVCQGDRRIPFVRHWPAVRRRPLSPPHQASRALRSRPFRLQARGWGLAARLRPWPGQFRSRDPAKYCPDRVNRCRPAPANPFLHRLRFSAVPVWRRARQPHRYRREAPPHS